MPTPDQQTIVFIHQGGYFPSSHFILQWYPPLKQPALPTSQVGLGAPQVQAAKQVFDPQQETGMEDRSDPAFLGRSDPV